MRRRTKPSIRDKLKMHKENDGNKKKCMADRQQELARKILYLMYYMEEDHLMDHLGPMGPLMAVTKVTI